MSTVVFDTSMSLDGYMTAAGRTPEEPMGQGGLQLVEWTSDRDYLERNVEGLGAVIAGRVTYDLAAGLVDEISIHLVPVLFGSGTPMFQPLDLGHVQLELLDTVESQLATHLRYRIVKEG